MPGPPSVPAPLEIDIDVNVIGNNMTISPPTAKVKQSGTVWWNIYTDTPGATGGTAQVTFANPPVFEQMLGPFAIPEGWVICGRNALTPGQLNYVVTVWKEEGASPIIAMTILIIE